MKKYKKVYIEITNICNLKCDFCPETKRKAEFMELSNFRKILEQIKPYAEYIHLHVKGEPLLHPNLDNFLDVSYEYGFKVNITTNGVLINKVADMLISKPAVRQINFSLHSFDGNQQSISKDEYIHNILDFATRAVSESDMIIAFRLWNLEEALIKEDQRERNLEILHKIEVAFKLDYKIECNLSEAKGLKIYDRVYLNQDFEFKWPDLKEEEDFTPGLCYGLKSQIAILVDGTVVPCCLDGEGVVALGNIYETEFSLIIQSRRAQDIRKGFSQNEVVEELCRKCGFRKRFNKASES